jgi:5-methylcytosine-specific restriction protein A
MAWSTSDRRLRLPKSWPAIRRQVIRRDRGRCQAQVHAPGCDGHGTEVDHIIPGDNHDLSNLMLLSSACHRAKTARESAARNAARAAMRRRPAEQHPGALR